MARREGEDGNQPPKKRIWNKNTEFPQPHHNKLQELNPILLYLL